MASIRQRDGKWQAQVRRKGVTPLVRSFVRHADAVRWARSIEATIDLGQEPPEASIMARTKFRELLTRYLAEVTPQKRSHRMETSRLNRLLKHDIADLTLDKLTSGVFASFRDQRLKDVGPQTVRHDLNLLSLVIKAATIDWDFPFKENPLDRLRKPRMPLGRTRRVSREEVEKLREGMPGDDEVHVIGTYGITKDEVVQDREREALYHGVMNSKDIAAFLLKHFAHNIMRQPRADLVVLPEQHCGHTYLATLRGAGVWLWDETPDITGLRAEILKCFLAHEEMEAQSRFKSAHNLLSKAFADEDSGSALHDLVIAWGQWEDADIALHW